jgi:phosphodiesterase/alkaline phosphatase D-like protein
MKSLISPLVVAVLFSVAAAAQNSSYNNSSYPGQGQSSTTQQMISNGPVAETVSDSSAFIGWSTKEHAASESLRYGTSRDHLSQTAEVTDTQDGKNHHAKLENLASETTYYFQITANGQAQGGIGTFRTVAVGDKPVQSKAVISQK